MAPAMTDDEAATTFPIVQDSVQHNAKTLSSIRTLTSPLLGLTAGALCLESTTGFAFFLAGTLLTSFLIYLGPAGGVPQKYFGSGARRLAASNAGPNGGGGEGKNWSMWMDIAFGGLGIEAFMGFVMSWTLVYNLVGT